MFFISIVLKKIKRKNNDFKNLIFILSEKYFCKIEKSEMLKSKNILEKGWIIFTQHLKNLSKILLFLLHELYFKKRFIMRIIC